MYEMKKLLAAVLLTGFWQATSASGMDIDHPWARATVEGMSMGGVFLTIENETKQDDVLVAASSPVSQKVELHNHINDNGVMRMREVEGGIPLPKGQKVMLKPGSYHVMLMGLKKPLKVGDEFPLTLKFKNAQAKTVTVEVENAPKGMKHGHDHHGHSHDHDHTH